MSSFKTQNKNNANCSNRSGLPSPPLSKEKKVRFREKVISIPLDDHSSLRTIGASCYSEPARVLPSPSNSPCASLDTDSKNMLLRRRTSPLTSILVSPKMAEDRWSPTTRTGTNRKTLFLLPMAPIRAASLRRCCIDDEEEC